MIGNVSSNQRIGFGLTIDPKRLIGNTPVKDIIASEKELAALGRHYEIVGLKDRIAAYESKLDVTPHSNRDLIAFYKKSIETTKNLLAQAQLNYEAFIKIIR